MAEESNGAAVIRTTSHIPIAQLTPLLLTPASRSIKAVVTLTWPYRSATGSVAFLLSEPDFRLRRTRGQVRVQFSGSSAKEVAKSGIASGDQVILSLDGVEWIHVEAAAVTPGKGVEFELKFTERLVLQFQQEDSQDVKTIDIDHPVSELEVAAPPRITTPELAISPSAASTQTSSAPPDSATKIDDEWISPAFIKRARTSYGSLFESDYDPFAEEDGTIRGKGRKRTRLSSTWRYSSRSPTPEADEEPLVTAPEPVTKPMPLMTDEGCQTFGLEDGGAAEALGSFARQATNAGRDSYPYSNGTMAREDLSLKEATLGDELSTMKPPTFGTQYTEREGLQRAESNQVAPISTNFPPVSPEFLSQASRNGPSSEKTRSKGVNQNGPDLQEQPQAVHGHPPTAVQEAEVLYGSSHAGRREELSELEVPDFHDLAPAVSGVEKSGFEDQYGRWQSSIAHLSHHASPYQATKDVNEDAEADRFYVQEGEEDEQYANNSFPTSHSEILHTHQYPEIDDGLPNQQLSGWGPGTGNVPYPELHDHIGGLEMNTTIYPPQPHSTAMSRSQSGQSQVVDLTESSDEEDEQPVEGFIEANGSIFEEEDEEGSLEESVDDEEEGSLGEGEEERAADLIQSGSFPSQGALEGEQEFGREEEDQDDQEDSYDDEELEDDEGDTLHQKFNVGPGQEFYDGEEEGSDEDEDEDMESGGVPARPPVQCDPIVIDLLSSDDEDDGQPARLKSAISAPPRNPQASANHSHKSEESEDDSEDEASDDENAVPYAERSELKTQIAPRNLARDDFAEEEDEVMEDESDQEGANESAGAGRGDAENDGEPSSRTKIARHNRPSSAYELLEEPESGEENGLVDAASVQHEGQNLQPEGLNEHTPAEVERHVEAAIPGQSVRAETTVESGLSPRIFQFDGANDEPAVAVSYPALPNDVPSPPASEQQGISQTSDSHVQKAKHAQLPTPEATQSSGKVLSTETSFASALGALPDQTELLHGFDISTSEIEIDQDEVTVGATGLLEVEVDAEQTEATALLTETQQTSIYEEDIETGKGGNPETVADPKSAKSDPLGEQDVAEQLSRERTEPESTEPKNVEELAGEEELNVKAGEPESTKPQLIEEQTVDQELDLEAGEPDSTKPQPFEEQILEEELNLEATEHESTESRRIQETDAVDSIAVDLDPHRKAEQVGVVTKEPKFTIDSPRRSYRRVKSTVTATETKESVHPVTPKKVGSSVESVGVRQERASPRVVLDSPASSRGHDASIELALSSLYSPSKQHHDLRKQPVADLKLRLSRTLRTELSEFTSLKVLRYHLNQKLDVLAVATTTPAEPLRAKNGPRHYQITFNITDPSIAPSGVTEIQIFRPYKDALPTIKAGDGVLLRNFQVISVKNRGFGLRSVQDEGSSWAVFKDEGDAEVRGPPVEFGDGEKRHVIALKAWYGTLDTLAMAKISRANGEKVGIVPGKALGRRVE